VTAWQTRPLEPLYRIVFEPYDQFADPARTVVATKPTAEVACATIFIADSSKKRDAW
jgi:hypothetical protein